MFPPPSVIGISICEQVIVDAKTNNPSLISVFTGRAFPSFPTEAIPFSIFCSLTNAADSVIIRLTVEHLEAGEEVFTRRFQVDFPNRLAVVNLDIRLSTLRFPSPRTYMFELFTGERSLARRRLRVYLEGDADHGV